MESIRGKLKSVWTITEHGGCTSKARIGIAWEDPSGTISARLDAFPVSGQLTIENWQPALEIRTSEPKKASG